MEDRLKPRIMTQIDVTINGIVKAYCFDINDEGMYVQSERDFKENSLINLDFALEDRPLKIKASVRHTEKGFGFGAKFINPTSEEKDVLRSFVSAQTAGEANLKIALLIDSNEQSRSVYKYRLTHDGFSVIEAKNGGDAIKMLQLTKPELVVLDMQTEGISAYKILQYIQTRDDLRGVPALILTNRFIPEEAEKLLGLGCRDYLIKATTSPNVFSEKVKKIMTSCSINPSTDSPS